MKRLAFLGMGKKKEENPTGTPFPDVNMPAMDQYGFDPSQQQAYGQYGYYPPQQPQAYPQQPQGPMQPPPQPDQSLSNEKIGEIVEAVVQEKWKGVEADLAKTNEWKDEFNNKLSEMSQRIDDIKGSLESLQKAILGKVAEYDENLKGVGTEIRAMEKVFSKVLPTLTDSINKLQRFSDNPALVKKKV